MSKKEKEDVKTLGEWRPYSDQLKDRVVILTDKVENMGEAVYWRKARKYNRDLRRYEDVSYWAALLTNMPIKFAPKYYKER